jgi:protein SCO1/2
MSSLHFFLMAAQTGIRGALAGFPFSRPWRTENRPGAMAAANLRESAVGTRWRTALASACVAVAGVLVAHAATDGFSAYTLESARRLKALRSPAPVPAAALELDDGSRAGLDAIAAPVLLVDFIYTRCDTYCSVLGAVFTQLQQRLAGEIGSGKVRLLSISFDPQHDGPAALAAYRARHRGDPQAWALGRPANGAELRSWLDAFGVVVVRDELGGYAHNAAVHVVGPDRKLVAIHDPRELDAVVASVHELLGKERHASLR